MLRRIWLMPVVLITFVSAAFSQPPRIEFQPTLAAPSTVTDPLYVTPARDGSGRLFIVEQAGRIVMLPHIGAPAAVFLDLRSKVLSGGERGMLGLAFHPNFSENHRLFVTYTRKPDGTIVLAEYHVSAADPNLADPAETVMLTIPHPNTQHHGGDLHFGPDGCLFISVGDGGSPRDSDNQAESLNSLLGKVLRIDVDEPASPTVPYSIPPDNPFVGSIGSRDEIYAYGFRNPWRFSIDDLTGQIYAGDVGENSWEEVDVIEPGKNYGWHVMEGNHCTAFAPDCNDPSFVAPIAEYVHTGKGGRCAITGGYIYRGSRETFPLGAYIFGDYCTGEVFMLYEGKTVVLADTAALITSFGEDEEGEIYLVGGSVYRMINTGSDFVGSISFEFDSDEQESALNLQSQDRTLSVLHAQIQPDGDAAIGAIAFMDARRRGVLVSEVAASPTPLIDAGRIGVEIGAMVNTGIGIANVDMVDPVEITFTFTDANGQDTGAAVLSIPPGGSVSEFLTNAPFDAPSMFQGSLTIRASAPVSIMALRSLLNERAELLTTTVPVVDLSVMSNSPVLVPHFPRGGGWSSQLTLLNPTDDAISGTIEWKSAETRLTYVLPPRSFRQINPASAQSTPALESLVVTPDNDNVAPAVGVNYRYTPAGVTVSVSAAAMAANSTKAAFYAALPETAIAVANPSEQETDLTLHFVALDGSDREFTHTLTLAGKDQRALFLSEIWEGETGLSGVLTLSSTTPVASLNFHTRYNERGDFLFAAIPPLSTTAPRETVLHVSYGGGLSTRMLVFSQDGSQSSGTGNIYFFDESGAAVVPQVRVPE